MHEAERLFAGGGAAGAQMRALDWAATPLGAPESWPPSLRSALSICLAAQEPIAIFWGAALVLLCNDAYRPLLDASLAIGQSLSATPLAATLAGVLQSGTAARLDDQPLPGGAPAPRFASFAYTPIRDERGAVAGVLGTAADTTARVVGARRLRILHALAMQIGAADSAEGACANAAAVLQAGAADVAFAEVYLLEGDPPQAQLAARAGCAGANGWHDAIERVIASGQPEYLASPGAAVLPLAAPGHRRLAGVLVAGTRTAQPPDDERAFFELLASQVAAAIGAAIATTAERHRALSEQAADRTMRLQAVTAALAETLTAEQVADVVLHQGVAALGGYAGSIALLTASQSELEIVGAIGYAPELLQRWGRFAIDAQLPLADAARTGELVAIESPAHWNARYLPATPTSTSAQAWAAIPLEVDGRVLGAMGLSFAHARGFSHDDRAYMLALAQQCAQALDRARLYAAERQARAQAEAAQVRLAFLAEASRQLASSLDYAITLETLAQLATPTLGDWCVVDLISDEGEVRRVAATHAIAAKRPLTDQLLEFAPQLGRDTPVTRVLHTGQAVLEPDFDDEQLARNTNNPQQIALLRALGVRSLLIVPLRVREQPLGALSLMVADSSWCHGPADQALAEELAARAAIALENALLYRETQAAVRARDELLSIVSHDLQNPLATIKLQAQMLGRAARRKGSGPPADLAEGLARIDAETTRMTTLIGELLDMARIQSGQSLELNRRPTNLVALVRQIVDARAPAPAHPIRVDAEQAELVALIDAPRIERLLGNLLSNAVKYSPGGGDVLVRLSRDAGWAQLSVRDHGLGVPASDLPYIFERFHRASNVSGRIGGTGIGLWSARRIVELHGGTIVAESQEGAGATFTVRLPLD